MYYNCYKFGGKQKKKTEYEYKMHEIWKCEIENKQKKLNWFHCCKIIQIQYLCSIWNWMYLLLIWYVTYYLNKIGNIEKRNENVKCIINCITKLNDLKMSEISGDRPS